MPQEFTLSRFDESSTNDENPYQPLMAKEMPEHRVSSEVGAESLLLVAMVWFAGTVAGGAMFGTMLFPIIGTAIGFVLAMITGLPTSLVFFTIAWVLPRTVIREPVVLGLGAINGGVAGFLAVSLFSGLNADMFGYTIVAMLFGACGSFATTFLYLKSRSDSAAVRYTPAEWADLDGPRTNSSAAGF